MPVIQAFRGIRYDLGHVGSLSDVVAPPYDVIDGDLQNALYKKHPANVVRLILNRDEPGDDETENRYVRAGRFLKNWLSEGVLQTEPDPAVYVYHQVFEAEGVRYERRGFMSRVRLTRFGEGNIYPHEETHAGPKADRLKLTEICKTNLSQIFSIYPDPESRAQNLLEAAVAGRTPIEATDHLGVVHRLWPVTDVKTIADVAAAMADKPVFVADGHHRYETACNYRDQLAAEGDLDRQHPANFVLMMLVSMSDPGMIVLPTHRLFRGMAPVASAELAAKLGDHFTVQIVGEGPESAADVWEEIETGDDQGTLGLYAAADKRWMLASITETGRARMAEVAAEHSPEWRGIGASILQRLVLETLLGQTDPAKPLYVHSAADMIDALRRGDTVGRDSAGLEGKGGDFPLAAMAMPATIEHVRVISQHGERMPAKSTYFYPKLLSGLVFNPLK